MDLVTFTEELLNGKLHFLFSVKLQKSWQEDIGLKSKFIILLTFRLLGCYGKCLSLKMNVLQKVDYFTLVPWINPNKFYITNSISSQLRERKIFSLFL